MNIGDRVGDYEIIDILGVGGMGQVYKVRNTLSERVEAMKILLPNLEGNAALADRFLREIKVQATLDHPNIAKFHTAMHAGNQLVMFMEFVDGASLARMIESGAIPVPSAVNYTSQVLDALAYAHSRGVVHRDIKPANIMITPAGAVKLMDFGIARMNRDERLTQAGGAVGSLHYMSPEQINGADPDGRADIYSLGITLYEMVTGRRPFIADSDFHLMTAHLKEIPVAPIEIVPGVPQNLSDIILMAIAKDPGQRFQTAAAFRAALSNLGAGTGRAPMLANTVKIPPASAPPPLPQAVPQQEIPQPPPSPAARGSRRGLYMALGSLATLVVLIAAAVEGPKWLRGGSSGAQSPAPVQDPAQSGSPQPPAQPAQDQPAPTPPPATDAQSTPAASPAVEPAKEPIRAGSTVSAPAISAPARAAAAPQRARISPTPSAEPEPAASRPVEAPRASSPPPQPAAQPPQSAPSVQASPELKELRERFNELSIKASALKDGLNMMQQRLASQGMSLRTDIVEERRRMDYRLQEAMQSITRGDAGGARENLTYGEGSAAKIAKFLGQ